ncbi:hypothetical protein [Chryseobacterium artocarpi]|nr:hypothetical protein [Chryseobacterium artocarpi]
MKTILYVLCLMALINCDKTKEMKGKLFPARPYEDAQIDKFYWSDNGWDYTMIPLLKPYQLTKLQGKEEWMLNTSASKNEISDATPIESISVNTIYIYGIQGERLNFENTEMNPKVYFLINTKDLNVIFFDKESAFKAELKKLNLPETFLNPDEVFEQYKNDPVLPWFPDDIKKRLEEVKVGK